VLAEGNFDVCRRLDEMRSKAETAEKHAVIRAAALKGQSGMTGYGPRKDKERALRLRGVLAEREARHAGHEKASRYARPSPVMAFYFLLLRFSLEASIRQTSKRHTCDVMSDCLVQGCWGSKVSIQGHWGQRVMPRARAIAIRKQPGIEQVLQRRKQHSPSLSRILTALLQ
jgi:hypothetical protein